MNITFKEMAEHEAVNVFEDDGYSKYEKQSDRGEFLPHDSRWYTSPARMFVGFNEEDTPVGVIGFRPFGKYGLSAGLHIREGYRKSDTGISLLSTFYNKMIEEKGNMVLFINFKNPKLISYYQSRGFKPVDLENLPEDLPEELQGEIIEASKHPANEGQLHKTLMYNVPQWFDTLKVA